MAARSGTGKGTLQRPFCCYVGVGPKRVIRRYRLREALDRPGSGRETPNLAELALEFGYFDQAHLVNYFEEVAGTAPARYARCARSTPAGGWRERGP